MIGKLNQAAIAVRDIEAATRLYRESLGATASAAVAQPEHGVTTPFAEKAMARIPSSRDPYRQIMRWLSPRIGKT
jgi:methylmalonyl-CoA/ethylmalonyl-CoA epimerase